MFEYLTQAVPGGDPTWAESRKFKESQGGYGKDNEEQKKRDFEDLRVKKRDLEVMRESFRVPAQFRAPEDPLLRETSLRSKMPTPARTHIPVPSSPPGSSNATRDASFKNKMPTVETRRAQEDFDDGTPEDFDDVEKRRDTGGGGASRSVMDNDVLYQVNCGDSVARFYENFVVVKATPDTMEVVPRFKIVSGKVRKTNFTIRRSMCMYVLMVLMGLFFLLFGIIGIIDDRRALKYVGFIVAGILFLFLPCVIPIILSDTTQDTTTLRFFIDLKVRHNTKSTSWGVEYENLTMSGSDDKETYLVVIPCDKPPDEAFIVDYVYGVLNDNNRTEAAHMLTHLSTAATSTRAYREI